MKHFKDIFRTLSLLFLITVNSVAATPDDSNENYMDSVEISLLTCSPHEEIYSLYGHTALRYRDFHREAIARGDGDIVFNWGVFNFAAPHFVARFVFGLTDYELGIGGFRSFCDYYRKWGSSITEQVLNLTTAEKSRVVHALDVNWKPQNRVYRYNFFYDNCSTRPRDIIESCVNGRIEYAERPDYAPSYRDMIHEKAGHHKWAAWGNDMLLGAKADLKTSRQEQEFLPENLMHDFDNARIVSDDKAMRPLVKSRRTAVPAGKQVVKPDFPLSPTACFSLLLVLSIAIAVLEWRRKKTFKYWDALLMLCTGATGTLIFVMFFSQHPTTSTNLQVLMLNPLPLFFIPAVLRRRHIPMFWSVSLVLLAVFFIASFWQVYAEGMKILALCLLTRIISNKRNG